MSNLQPFLPTKKELDWMSNFEFEIWVDKALHEIPKRKELRDPISHLKNRISQIITSELSEHEKEEKVFDEIVRYKELIHFANQRDKVK